LKAAKWTLAYSRYTDFAGLEGYCHLVAGIVGEVAAKIFGQTDAATTTYAHKLGLAFQLTNILRDVGEDALRGRIYLPLQELERSTFRPATSLSASIPSALPPSCNFKLHAPSSCMTKPWPCCPKPIAAPKTRADDGQHLPHPAARD
jgi:hypothetical protein